MLITPLLVLNIKCYKWFFRKLTLLMKLIQLLKLLFFMSYTTDLQNKLILWGFWYKMEQMLITKTFKEEPLFIMHLNFLKLDAFLFFYKKVLTLISMTKHLKLLLSYALAKKWFVFFQLIVSLGEFLLKNNKK